MNYPPGVTGGEYEISGPDTENDAVAYCEDCDDFTDGVARTFGRDAWFVCGVCEETTELNEEPDGPDDRRQMEIERG